MSTMICPVGFGLADGFHHFIDALDAAFAVGEGAFFFEEGGGGQDHVGITGRFGHKYFLDDEQIQRLQGFDDLGGVRVRLHQVFAHDPQGFELAFEGSIVHLRDG